MPIPILVLVLILIIVLIVAYVAMSNFGKPMAIPKCNGVPWPTETGDIPQRGNWSWDALLRYFAKRLHRLELECNKDHITTVAFGTDMSLLLPDIDSRRGWRSVARPKGTSSRRMELNPPAARSLCEEVA